MRDLVLDFCRRGRLGQGDQARDADGRPVDVLRPLAFGPFLPDVACMIEGSFFAVINVLDAAHWPVGLGDVA